MLQRELGGGYHVVEEGLGGRTTVYDDPLLPRRSGRELLAPALECHAPLDLVVFMLATNDISYAHISAADAADGAASWHISCSAASWAPEAQPRSSC